MLVKFFARGTGKGSSVMSYLVQPVNANGQRREPLPEVLSGDPTLCASLIDSIERKHKYTSGVIAFHDDDEPSLEQQLAVMDEFEKVSFSGLEPNQYHCCWVRHEHCGNVELHFVTPKIELNTGKQLNIKPPGSTKVYDTFRDYFNTQNDWADPDAPERAQELRLQLNMSQTQKRLKEQLHSYIKGCRDQAIQNGLDYNRKSVLSDLNALDGVSVSKEQTSSVSVILDGHKRPINLPGEVYEEQYSALRASDTKEAAREDRSHKERSRERNKQAREELNRIIASRSKFNRERYGIPTEEIKRKHGRDEQESGSVDQQLQRLPQGNKSASSNDLIQTSKNTKQVKINQNQNQKKSSLDFDNHTDSSNSWNSFSNWNRGITELPQSSGVVLDVSKNKSRPSTNNLSPKPQRSKRRETESTNLLQRVREHLQQANRIYRELREYQEELRIRIEAHYQRIKSVLTASYESQKQIERDRERYIRAIETGTGIDTSKPYSVRHNLNNVNVIELANRLKQQHQQEQERSYRRSSGRSFGM